MAKQISTQQKITVSLPKQLVARLDQVVGSRQRSYFIALAIQEQLALLEQSAAIEDSAGVWTAERYPDLSTEADIDKFIHELRAGWLQEDR